MKKFNALAAATLVASLAVPGSVMALDAKDPAFKPCKQCHTLKEGKRRVGPSLFQIVGKPAGTMEKFKYSKLMKAANEAGLVWDQEKITIFVQNPTKFLTEFIEANGGTPKGKSKMVKKFKPEQANAVATFLASE